LSSKQIWGITAPQNKELKLTNLERIEGSQLNSDVGLTVPGNT
jgi:hypothetical protein